jgi:hypothetical protein
MTVSAEQSRNGVCGGIAFGKGLRSAYRALTVRLDVTRTVGRATMEEEAMANMLLEGA